MSAKPLQSGNRDKQSGSGCTQPVGGAQLTRGQSSRYTTHQAFSSQRPPEVGSSYVTVPDWMSKVCPPLDALLLRNTVPFESATVPVTTYRAPPSLAWQREMEVVTNRKLPDETNIPPPLCAGRNATYMYVANVVPPCCPLPWQPPKSA